jgi:hypothetical protein
MELNLKPKKKNSNNKQIIKSNNDDKLGLGIAKKQATIISGQELGPGGTNKKAKMISTKNHNQKINN